MKRLLHTDDAGVRGVRDLIRSLSPRPGAAFSKAEANYVIPDVVVRKVRNQWVASLNEAAMPKLRLNRIYADILTRNRESSNQQLAAQLQEAKWLIRNVQQRFDTILRVAQAIVERQRRFFEHGEVAMRPMVLREIADMLSLHESTISRVTTQKYMLTPRGTFELKYFFGSHVATDTGGAASATAIRALIKQLVGAEDPKTPLTDSRSPTCSASRASSSRAARSPNTASRCRFLRSTCARRSDAVERSDAAHPEESPMNLNLTGHHLDITPAIRAYVVTKLERVTRHFDHVIDVHVVLVGGQAATEGRGERARARQGHPCESVDADMYAAIDALADKLDRQVLKHKELLKDHRCDNAAIERAAAEPVVEGGGSALGDSV